LDLQSGRQVKLTRGPLRSAVLASTAIPGIFPPVEIGGKQLVDIGVIDALPVAVARDYGSDLTIAVDVGAEVEPSESLDTAKDIFLRISDVTERHVRHYTRGMADLLIRPEVAASPWYDFSRPEELIESGRIAARQAFHNKFAQDLPKNSEPQRVS
jgi:NTE family protein